VRPILVLGATCACLLLVPSARTDPTSLVLKKFFGGSRNNTPAGIAVDSQGNIYVAGQTNSADFPVLQAVQDHPGAAALSTSSDGGRTFARAALRASAVNGLAATTGTPTVLYAATDAGIQY
jgi:Beta-propeller repeat